MILGRNINVVLIHLCILFSCFTYPITAFFIYKVNVESTIVNISLRAFYLILNLFLLILSGFTIRQYSVSKVILPIVVFFAIYTIRLLADTLLFNVVYGGGSVSYIYAFYFGATIIPMICIILCNRYIDKELLFKQIFLFLLIANFFIVYIVLEKLKFNTEYFFHSRVSVKQDPHSKDNLINPITIGINGALIAALSLSTLVFKKLRFNKSFIIVFIGFLIGIVNMFLGASRGPFVAFLICVFLISFRYYNLNKFSFVKLFKLFSIIILSLFLIYTYIFNDIKKSKLVLITRSFDFLEQRSKGKEEYRDLAFNSAIQDFKESPFFGKQYVGTFDNFYPHNIFIEVLMATGLIGGFFFLLYILIYFWSIFLVLYQNKDYITFNFLIISIITFVLSMTSGSVFASPECWIMSVLLLILGHNSNFNSKPVIHKS